MPGAVARRARATACAWAVAAWAAGAGAQALPPLVASDGQLGAGWRLVSLPQPKFPLTRYSFDLVDGRPALRIEAQASYGNWVHATAARAAPQRLSWSWRVPQANATTELREKAGDDTAARVCMSFDLPLDRVPFFERQLLRLARSQSPEPLPAATLCWAWGAREARDSLIDNAYSRRVRYIVLRNETDAGGRWFDEKRDVAADLRRAFGDEIGAGAELPPLSAVIVSGDADNTGAHSLAHISALRFEP